MCWTILIALGSWWWWWEMISSRHWCDILIRLFMTFMRHLDFMDLFFFLLRSWLWYSLLWNTRQPETIINKIIDAKYAKFTADSYNDCALSVQNEKLKKKNLNPGSIWIIAHNIYPNIFFCSHIPLNFSILRLTVQKIESQTRANLMIGPNLSRTVAQAPGTMTRTKVSRSKRSNWK